MSAVPDSARSDGADPVDDHEGDIAIVGMSGRFPGADDPDELWSRVVAGDDCLLDVDHEALRAVGLDPALLGRADYVGRSGALGDVAGFDPAFFGIGVRDAAIMDPQHRHFLECAWEAIEAAGIVPETFGGAIGVFGGSGMNTYLINNVLTNPKLIDDLGWFLVRHTGNDKDFLVNEVAYRLDLHGPAVNVQTACSTSLVAVHLAIQSLLSYECDLALAGGATIEVPHGVGYTYREGEILSPDGRCRAFDAASNGTVLTSGVGLVALRRLGDALTARDPVLAVIKGSAINNDGARKVGFLAPSVDGHADVVREALTVAGVSAHDLQLVEAHGTGTAVGDPIEVAALSAAFSTFTDERGFCRLTSTKPNIGHLDTAAGVASLIKVVQALRHRTLPPMANHTAPSTTIDLDRTPFVVSGEAAPWATDGPRRAGISSLGVGGTNAHVVVEEAPALDAPPSAREQLLVLSARSAGALDRASGRLAEHLVAHPGLDVGDVATTLATGRRAMPHRRVVAATDTAHAAALLPTPDRHRRHDGTVDDEPIRLGFMFPGGGSQFAGMASGLDGRFAVLHDTRRAGARIVRELSGLDLEPMFDPSAPADALRRPSVSLPLVFLTSVGLARQWMSFGAAPDVLLGHSLGEYVAAHLAGVLTFDDALTLVVTRSRLMEQVGGPDAAMLVVPLPADDVRSLLPAGLSLAAINAADECVVAGRAADVREFAAALEHRDVTSTEIPLGAAAHSSLLDPVLDEFETAVRSVSLRAPELPYLSNLTGTWITADQATDPGYWVRHLRGTVRFAECLCTAIEGTPIALTELGPGHTLSSYARRNAPRPASVVPVLRHPEQHIDDTAFALAAVGRLWACGVPVDLTHLIDRHRRRVPLPTYPFEHQRCWIEPGALPQRSLPDPSLAGVPAADPTPTIRRVDDLDGATWTVEWTASTAAPASPTRRRWIVVADDDDDLGDQLVEALGRRGAATRTAAASFESIALGRDDDPAGIVVVAPADSDADAIERRWFGDAAAAAIELGATANGRLVVVTREAVPADGLARRPLDAMAAGVALVAPEEYPGLSACHVDAHGSTSVDDLVDEITGDATGTVALRRAGRLVPEVRRRPIAGSSGHSYRTGGSYLITGGLGAVGHAIAMHLARDHRANLALVTTEDIPAPVARSAWLAAHAYDDPTSRRIRRLVELELLGTKVVTVTADLSDHDQVMGALDRATELIGPLDGAVHAAGVVRDRLLEIASPVDHHAVLGAKAFGAWALARELERRRATLLVNLSSTSTTLAPAGQGSYVGANAVLDAMIGRRGQLRVVTLDSGLWSGTGVASDVARRGRLGLPAGDAFTHPILGEIHRAPDGTTTLVGRLCADHHWVIDEHRTAAGTPVFPGTAFLELMLTAVCAAGHPHHLEEVVIAQPLAVPPGRRVTVRVTVSGGSTPLVQVESDAGTGDEWSLHAQGRAGVGVGLRTASIDDRKLLPTEIVDPFDAQRRHLDLGPRWTDHAEVRRGDGTVTARIGLPDGFGDEATLWAAHPALVDAATAVALMTASPAVDAPLWVPAGYRRVVAADHVPAAVDVIVTRSADATPDRLVVDLVATDLAGDTVLQIDGLDLRASAGAALSDGIGPAARPADPHRTLADLADSHGLTAAEGVELIDRLVASSHDRIIGSTIDLDDLRSLSTTALDQSAGEQATVPVPATTAADLEARLTAMWTDLLGVGDIGPDDDFFDLGGHSLIAIRLMARIQRELDVKLHLAVFFEASTVATLAARLRREHPDLDDTLAAAAPDDPAGATRSAVRTAEARTMTQHLVPISTVGPGRPIYIVHGAGGNVLFLWSLARAMSGERPVYGFQAHGIEGDDLPDATIELMAQRYVGELRAHGPGPYVLGGFSGGGVVTMEMARQLQAQGEQVRLAVLFDSPSPAAAPATWWRRQRNLFAHARRGRLRAMRPYLRSVVVDRVHRLVPERRERVADRDDLQRTLGYSDTGVHGFTNLYHYFTASVGRYEPPVFGVDVLLLKADTVWPTQTDDYGWGRHVDGTITVRTVPGDHHSMFYPENAPQLAAELRPILVELDESGD